MGTLFSLIAALIFTIYFYSTDIVGMNVVGIVITMVIIAIFFLFSIPMRSMFSWVPFQKAESSFAPGIIDLFQRDHRFTLLNGWIILFSFVTFLIALTQSQNPTVYFKWILVVWIILFGLTIDASIYSMQRIVNYLNPYAVIKLFSSKAKKSIQNEKELDLCHWIDGLTEIAIKGLDQNGTSITHQALDELQKNARLFFESSKSISHHPQDEQTLASGIGDKVTFITFYLYQRLDMVFEKALKKRFEPTCSHIITLLGRLAIDAAKYDISLASPPLRFIGKLSKRAQDEGLDETALKASCTLLEVGKIYVKEIDLSYLEIKDPFLSIINGTEQLAKGMFKKDKNYNLLILGQPFKELKELFQSEKMSNHIDTPIILQNINRVLGEFEALQLVMTTIPPMPLAEDKIEEK